MPLTLRLIAYSLRAVMRAGLLFLCAWLLLIPVTASERDKLGALVGDRYPTGLRQMRAAQAFIAIAPSQAYVIVGSLVAPNVPPYAIKIGLMQMASGNVLPPSAVLHTTPVNDQQRTTAPQGEPFSARDIEGPRFIRVD